MPDAHSIPFRQASGNGHYESKQLPNDNADFLVVLGLPTSVGNVTSASPSSLDGQLAAYWGTNGQTIKASALIGIVNLVDGVVTTKATPAGEIVGTTAVQTLTNKTITGSTITAPTGITKGDVGLGNVDNTSDANKPVSGPQQTALNLKQDLSGKAVANGYASLDSGGKVPTAQLPTTVQGTVSYQGTWNAATNTPTIPVAAAGNRGWYYVVSVAGTVAIGLISDWGVGDWLVSNGTSWDKIDNTDALTSVAGRTGAIVLTKADVGLDQVDNTSDATKNSAAAVLTNKTINGTNNTLTVRLDADVANNLPVTRLNNGIGATNQSWWCGDGTWRSPVGAGDVVGPPNSVNGEIALYNGSSGKLLQRATATGNVIVNAGVMSAVTQPAGALVGTTEAQDLSNKRLADPLVLPTGSSVIPYRPSGVLYANPVTVSMVGASSVLHQFTIPAGLFVKIGDNLRLTTWVRTAANANNKSITIDFGSYRPFIITSTFNAASMEIHVDFWKRTTTEIVMQRWYINGVSLQLMAAVATMTENLAAPIIVLISGASGTAGDLIADITRAEFLPAP